MDDEDIAWHGGETPSQLHTSSINQIPTDYIVSVVEDDIPLCSILSLAPDPLLVRRMHSRLMIIDGPCSA